MQKAAEKVAYVLGTNAYSKMDFIADSELKEFICIECDSLPQLYPDSQLVLSAKAAGRNLGDLLDKIMEMSLIRKYN